MSLTNNSEEIPQSLQGPRAVRSWQVFGILFGIITGGFLFNIFSLWKNEDEVGLSWILINIVLAFLIQIASRISNVIYLYSNRIEKGWKIPFYKILYRGQTIQKEDFFELQLPQKEDLSFDIIVKSKKGTFIVLENKINKNPALEKLERLRSEQFKSWTSNFNPIQK